MPITRTGANSTKDKSDATVQNGKSNMAATNVKPSLEAIFDVVKSTNQTVTSMETRLKRLEEKGKKTRLISSLPVLTSIPTKSEY